MPELAVVRCARCQSTLRMYAYEVRTAAGRSPRCLKCALIFGPMLRRSLLIAAIVGTILTAINQGNTPLNGYLPRLSTGTFLPPTLFRSVSLPGAC